MNYLVKTRSILNKMDKYPKLLKWDLSPSVSAKINDCLNSDEAYKVILKFSKETNISKDRVFALCLFMLSIIDEIKEPKVIADYSKNFDGVYDFQFILDDYIEVQSKVPLSKPKRDPQKILSTVPKSKLTKVTYTFGLEYDPRTGLMKIRYKFYPQRNFWGFRFDEKHRTFEDLLQFIAKDLPIYIHTEEDISQTNMYMQEKEDQKEDEAENDPNKSDEENFNSREIDYSINTSDDL